MPLNEPPLPSADQQAAWIEQDADENPSLAGWRQFLLELRVAHSFGEQPEHDHRVPKGRAAILQALVGLSDFLNKHKVIQDDGLALPFHQLIQAFYDLSNGQKPAILQPVAPGRGGASIRQAAKANITAVAARALDEFMKVPIESRMSLPVAAKMVAQIVQKARLPGYEKCSGRTVQKWREHILAAERGTEKASAVVMDRWRARLPDEAGDTAKSRAEFLLNHLRTSPALRWE